MTPARIQSLVGLGFEWDRYGVTWEERLSSLSTTANQGCNVYELKTQSLLFGSEPKGSNTGCT
jgi:hypothetical protein